MENLTVKTKKPYTIYFRHSFDDIPNAFKQLDLLNRKIIIITDNNVAPIYLNMLKNALNTDISFSFPAGEPQKHLNTIANMYSCFLEHKLDRRSVVVALGGGVVGDMAGFAAATFMRGIPYVQVPTSLLAQVDSSVGGKTAVDFGGVKNLVGAFCQPKLVYVNLSTLNTLSQNEFISGMGEAVKHAIIGDKAYNDFLSDSANIKQIKTLQPAALLQLIKGSCQIKAAVVASDETEQGLRETLNFGHCVGHAIESLSNYTLLHGCCVAIGMCAALSISHKKGNITAADFDNAVKLIKSYDLPTTITGYNAAEILAHMYKDKKTLNDTLRIVLLQKIGTAYTDNSVPEPDIITAIGAILE
ncbi:MAG: 3-dehydroquinate synthase [Defluviitaleaceae bacterium]|nr:3-dehydroquinate synthase [Defluviitaleaceae bacterium]